VWSGCSPEQHSLPLQDAERSHPAPGGGPRLALTGREGAEAGEAAANKEGSSKPHVPTNRPAVSPSFPSGITLTPLQGDTQANSLGVAWIWPQSIASCGCWIRHPGAWLECR